MPEPRDRSLVARHPKAFYSTFENVAGVYNVWLKKSGIHWKFISNSINFWTDTSVCNGDSVSFRMTEYIKVVFSVHIWPLTTGTLTLKTIAFLKCPNVVGVNTGMADLSDTSRWWVNCVCVCVCVCLCPKTCRHIARRMMNG